MKTKERQGVEKGSYVIVFKEIIRPQNKLGLRKSGKDGKERLMFHFRGKANVSEKDKKKAGTAAEAEVVEVPGSIVWDFDDPRTISTIAALGVSLSQLKKVAEKVSLEKALIWFEKMAKEKKKLLVCWVNDKGGWASAIHPFEGSYTVIFKGIATRDQQTDKPSLEDKPGGTFPSPRGGSYTVDPYKQFKTRWEILDTDQKGAQFTWLTRYPFVKDEEDDEWIVDAESRYGQEAKNLLTLHRINTDKMEPDRDFADPENGLPELEKLMLKRATPLKCKFNHGWPAELSKPLESVLSDDGVDVGDGGGSKYQADAKLIGKLFAMIDKRVRQHRGKSAWMSDGELSRSGKEWLLENKLGTKFDKYDDDRVTSYIVKLREDFPLE